MYATRPARGMRPRSFAVNTRVAYMGLLKNLREVILGCAHAFEVHSPLEGVVEKAVQEKSRGVCRGRISCGPFAGGMKIRVA